MTVEDRARQAARDIHRAVEAMEASATGERTTGERFDRFRARKDRNRRIGSIALVVAVLVVIAFGATSMVRNTHGGKPADTGTPLAPMQLGTVTITNAGCTLDGGGDVGEGPYTLNVVNQTDGARTIVVFKISSDARFARMLAVIERVRPRFGNPAHRPGHASEDARLVSGFFEYASTSETDIDAHGSLAVSGAFDPGTYGIQCAGRSPERDSASDFIGPIDVGHG